MRAALGLAVALSAPAAVAQTVSIGTPVTPGALQLVVSTQVNGQVTAVSCDGGAARPAVLRVAEAFAGERDALALDAGDLVGAAAASRLAMQWDADRFARALVSTGLRALAVGPRDLTAPRATLLRAAGALGGGVFRLWRRIWCAPRRPRRCAGPWSRTGRPPRCCPRRLDASPS